MGNVRVVNLGKYDKPKAVEDTREDWVAYGESNGYYDYLLEAKDSPTNSALINGITDMIYGRGLSATDAARKPDEYAQMLSIFKEEDVRRHADDFYTLGDGVWQLLYNDNKTKIVEAVHMAAQSIRPEKCDDNGDIRAYYYADDWSQIDRTHRPDRIPAFGFGKASEKLEIMVVKPYRSGHFYFSPVEYESGLDYAFCEIEMAEMHLNNIHNRFSANTIINFNNGRPADTEEMDSIEMKIRQKFTGADGDGLVIAFNDNAEQAASIENPNLSNPHEQYSFLSEEARRQLMISHRVTSPLLFGLPQNGGLGSNADEIKMASALFDNTVIKPMQRVILAGINQILSFNGITLNTYFKTSQPLDFTEVDADEVGKEEKEETSGVEMHTCLSSDKDALNDDAADELIELGEDINADEWDLIDEGEVDYDLEDDIDAEKAETPKESNLKKMYRQVLELVSTGTARPNSKSEQDKVVEDTQFKVRYRYSPDSVGPESREFCKRMVAANKLYRKEDIQQMDKKAVNPGFGPDGASTYSIWKYKGGAQCHHRWRRLTFRKKGAEGSIDVRSPKADTVSTNQAEREGYRIRNPKEPFMRPVDMPNNGYKNPR